MLGDELGFPFIREAEELVSPPSFFPKPCLIQEQVQGAVVSVTEGVFYCGPGQVSPFHLLQIDVGFKKCPTNPGLFWIFSK